MPREGWISLVNSGERDIQSTVIRTPVLKPLLGPLEFQLPVYSFYKYGAPLSRENQTDSFIAGMIVSYIKEDIVTVLEMKGLDCVLHPRNHLHRELVKTKSPDANLVQGNSTNGMGQERRGILGQLGELVSFPMPIASPVHGEEEKAGERRAQSPPSWLWGGWEVLTQAPLN